MSELKFDLTKPVDFPKVDFAAIQSVAEAGADPSALFIGSLIARFCTGRLSNDNPVVDEAAAFQWAQTGYRQGDALSAGWLAFQLKMRWGVLDADINPQNIISSQAQNWLVSEARKNHPYASLIVGLLYENGIAPFVMNSQKAGECYRPAANTGEPHAQLFYALNLSAEALATAQRRKHDSAKYLARKQEEVGTYLGGAAEAGVVDAMHYYGGDLLRKGLAIRNFTFEEWVASQRRELTEPAKAASGKAVLDELLRPSTPASLAMPWNGALPQASRTQGLLGLGGKASDAPSEIDAVLAEERAKTKEARELIGRGCQLIADAANCRFLPSMVIIAHYFDLGLYDGRVDYVSAFDYLSSAARYTGPGCAVEKSHMPALIELARRIGAGQGIEQRSPAEALRLWLAVYKRPDGGTWISREASPSEKAEAHAQIRALMAEAKILEKGTPQYRSGKVTYHWPETGALFRMNIPDVAEFKDPLPEPAAPVKQIGPQGPHRRR
jgi:TPR repeat protein